MQRVDVAVFEAVGDRAPLRVGLGVGIGHALGDRLADARLQFGRGAFGERRRENLLGKEWCILVRGRIVGESPSKHPHIAGRQRGCLARPGAGRERHVSVERVGRGLLFGSELVEVDHSDGHSDESHPFSCTVATGRIADCPQCYCSSAYVNIGLLNGIYVDPQFVYEIVILMARQVAYEP